MLNLSKLLLISISLWGAFLLIWCSSSPQKQFLVSYDETVSHLSSYSWQNMVDFEIIPQQITHALSWDINTSLRSYGTWTEPLILRASEWDVLNFEVTNNLPQETTIHRHGVRVPFDQDGVPWLTQDPIRPWENFTYTYQANDTWTFWFHPHINTAEQVARWLYWILVIDEEVPLKQQAQADQEWIWALKDYRLADDGTLDENFEIWMDHTMWGRLWNTRTINNIVNPVYIASPWERVLIRLVNTSSARIYNLDLTDRDAIVLESDGWRIKQPYTPSILQMWVGERYTILVNIPQDQQKLHLNDIYFPEDITTLWTISIDGDEPLWAEQTIPDLWDVTIEDRRILQGSEPDFLIELWGTNVSGWDKQLTWSQAWRTLNGMMMHESEDMKHDNPLFHMIMWEMYIVRMNNKSGRDHPMHLHGDFFQVIWTDGYKRPYAWWKDTVNVPANWYTDIALIPTNPWTWMFHCHINEHAEFGMMATVVVE